MNIALSEAVLKSCCSASDQHNAPPCICWSSLLTPPNSPPGSGTGGHNRQQQSHVQTSQGCTTQSKTAHPLFGLEEVYTFVQELLRPSGTQVVAIDNKIEQAMDLVKTHLMYAVREEVEVLKEKIIELERKLFRLELENKILRDHAAPDVLAKLVASAASPNSTANGPATNQLQANSIPTSYIAPLAVETAGLSIPTQQQQQPAPLLQVQTPSPAPSSVSNMTLPEESCMEQH